MFSETLYEYLRQDSFRQTKITKGVNKLSAAQQTCIQPQPQIPGGKEVQTKCFFACEIRTPNLAFWGDAERVLDKEVCFNESCACRERGMFQRMVCFFPKNQNPILHWHAWWLLRFRQKRLPCHWLFQRHSPKLQRTKSKECLGEHFSWSGSALPSSSYLGAAHWFLSQLACFVCSNCKRKNPSSQEFASAMKQSAVLTSQEIFWFEKDMSQKETLDLKGSKSVQQSSTAASIFLVSYTSVDN